MTAVAIDRAGQAARSHARPDRGQEADILAQSALNAPADDGADCRHSRKSAGETARLSVVRHRGIRAPFPLSLTPGD